MARRPQIIPDAVPPRESVHAGQDSERAAGSDGTDPRSPAAARTLRAPP